VLVGSRQARRRLSARAFRFFCAGFVLSRAAKGTTGAPESGVVQRMRESYGEGAAIHTGPESCVGHREVGGEALAGVRAGRVFSPESTSIGVPTLSVEAEGYILSIVSARGMGTPRGPRPRACTEAPRTLPGRSLASPLAAKQATGRSGTSEDTRR
jgi:hypothetical protein